MDRLPLMIGLLLMYEVKSQDPSLTINPNPVDEGGQVDITCSYTKEGSFFNVAILHEHDFLCRYANDVFNIYNNSFKERIEHTPQVNYNNHIKITLTNVTKEDSGTYRCTVEGNSQKEATSLLDVYVPPRSMRVLMTSPPPYKENDQYMVNCTFSMYPSPYNELLQRQIKRGDDTRTSLSYIQAEGLYEVTIYGWFTLRKEDNGEKPITCELTWKRTKIKYSAQLKTALNVTFAGTLLALSMENEYLTVSTNTNAAWPTCIWGSANPPKPITWIFKDVTVSAANIGDRSALPSTSHYEAGEFHGQTIVSRLTVTRELNQREVSCCVRDEKLHCKHSEVLDVIFPPTTSTITVSAAQTDGEMVILTCTTDSSRPSSEITWEVPVNLDGNITTSHWINTGDFGGNVSMSVLQVTVHREHSLLFICRVRWNGEEIQGLKRYYILERAITTSPILPSTVSEDDTNSQVLHSSNTPDNTGSIIAIVGGSLGGLLVVSMIIIIVIVILWKRQVPFPGNTDREKKAPTNHVYENDGAEHTTTTEGQRGESQRAHGEGEYEDVTTDVQNTYNSLGPHTTHESPPPPNVYDRLSPYENQ